MAAKNKDLRKLLKQLEAQGWRIKPSKKGVKAYSPDGSHVQSIHMTNSDHRAYKNIVRDLKKGGFDPNA